MSIKVLYFASLRETLGYSHETLTLPANIATLGDLRDHLARRGGVWEALEEGRNVRAAINVAILEGLRAAKIDIPYPQRVLRVESLPEGVSRPEAAPL